MYQRDETIAAICTPPGEGGVAIVRISGPQAVPIANQMFSGDVDGYESHTVHFGRVLDGADFVDDALCIVMKGGRSYTGDQTVEIHCHGGALISRRVLQVALDRGARAAQPGEFTFRAFMNGKLDLAQAEAVQQVIHAQSDLAVDAAEEQLQGRLSKRIGQFQTELTEIAAILEAWVDFPEEGLEFATLDELLGQLQGVVSQMQKLEGTFEEGRLLDEGVSIALVGAPNVGKSSLMNALLDRERAIVTDVAGTTRDLLEDHIRLGGLKLKLIDTAGIRETSELIEQEGIRRSRQAMEKADVTLLVLDASRPVTPDEQELCSGKVLVVWNKIDLVDRKPEPIGSEEVHLSAKEKQGLDTLQEAIDRLIWKEGPPSREELLITNVRHKEALTRSITDCTKTMDGLRNGLSPEFVCLDLRAALKSLGQIIGTDVTEDVLSSIFSRFCIGK